MKIAIDISISTSAGRAFGNASGTLEFDVVPQIGDTISFAFPKAQGLAPVAGFTGILRVRDRVLSASGELGISLVLEDIVVPSVDHARAVAEYLEKGFGLGINEY